MDKEKQEKIIAAFAGAVRLPADLSPSEWASGRVRIMDGLSPEFDIENVPWMREPMDALANPDAREIVVMAPIGTGKSTMLEAACSWIVSEDPGPTLIVAQTDVDLQDWAETRLDYAFKNTPDVKGLYPKDRHKAGKMKILWPHMPMFLTGANMSGLQSKSMRRVMCDEVWQWRPGRLREAKGRLHDRWNRQIFMMSQGGVENDDLDVSYKKGTQSVFSFKCPCCGRVQPWKMANLKFDDVPDRENRNNIESAKTARIVCDNPDCDYVIEDSPVQRRQLARSAFYVANSTGSDGCFSYRYNVLANWRKPLREIAEDWLDANDELRRGNVQPLKQFIQKRLAESWEEREQATNIVLSGGGYKIADYANGEPYDGEILRNMMIDRQQDHFWTRIRAFRANGDSRLLWAGRVNTVEALRDLQKRYKVPDKVTCLDARFDTSHVYDICAEYDWTALMGDKDTEFVHVDKRTGNRVRKMFSKVQEARSVRKGRNVRLILWTNGKVKDFVHRLRSGMADCAFEVPDDCPQEWHEQMNGEVKKEIVGKGDNQIEFRWVRIGKRDNHLWDCECMGAVIAMVMGVFSGEIGKE